MGAILRKVGTSWRDVLDLARIDGIPAGLASDPDAPAPYAIPAASPYNAPMALSTPTYEGSGQAIHPKVIDFGASKWKGWRYWMAHTPFPGNNDRHENPAILVSQNGYYWQKPAGVRDPLYPAPPVPGFGSDTHLTYDPDADQLVVMFRQTLDRTAHTIHIARSSDGVTWPASTTVLPVPYPDTDQQTISPALIRVASGDWRLFGLDYAARALTMWKAPAAEGPWSGPYKTVGTGISGPTWNWHLEVDRFDGVFRLLMDRGPVHEAHPDFLRSASSLDGLSWTQGTDLMTKGPAGSWDDGELYRACLLPNADGTKYRIWYSAHDEATVQTWGIGYTEVPATLWPAPPTALTSGASTAYRTLALSHSPLVLWRLGADPTSTTTEPDASGNDRTGTYTGRAVRGQSMTGETGYSSRLDQGVIYRAYEPSLTDFTVQAVIHPETVFSGKTVVALQGANGGWRLKLQGGFLQFVHVASGTTVTGGAMTDNFTTAHVAVVKSGTTVTTYRNGVQAGQATVSGTDNVTGARLSVGAYWTGTAWAEFWSGRVEYASLHPTALTAAQIAASSTEALT